MFNTRFGQPPGPEMHIPFAFVHVWNWFWSLAARRQVSQGSIGPLTFADIGHWASVMRIEIREEEVSMILAMDDAYMEASAIEHESSRARKQAAEAARPKPKLRGRR